MNPVIHSTTVEMFALFTRIASFLLLLPGFGTARLPSSIRLILILALTGVLAPLVSGAAGGSESVSPLAMLKLMFLEAMAGAIIGLGTRIYILAVSFIGTSASLLIGFNTLASQSLIDNEAEPALASLLSFGALLVILTLDFHHMAIIGLVDSYRVVPMGSHIPIEVSVSALLSKLTDSFLIVLRLGSPFIAYAIVANLFIALLNKLTPALQLYFIATPAIVFGGLILAYFAFPLMLSQIGDSLSAFGP